MNVERQPGSLSGLSDDALGSIAVSLVVSEVQWTPDVAPAVLDRLTRDAVTYPDQFDRRPTPPTAPGESGAGERSSRRTISRLAVFGVLLAIVALAASAIYAVTFLPASLTILGPNIDRLSVRHPTARIGLYTRLVGTAPADSRGVW